MRNILIFACLLLTYSAQAQVIRLTDKQGNKISINLDDIVFVRPLSSGCIVMYGHGPIRQIVSQSIDNVLANSCGKMLKLDIQEDPSLSRITIGALIPVLQVLKIIEHPDGRAILYTKSPQNQIFITALSYTTVSSQFSACIGGGGSVSVPDEVIQGVVAPTNPPGGTQGGLYLNTALGDLYTWNGSVWTLQTNPQVYNLNLITPLPTPPGPLGSIALKTVDANGTKTLAISNGTIWIQAGGTFLDTLAVNTIHLASQAVTGGKIDDMGASSGQVLKWNGSTWAPAADIGGSYTAGTGIDITGTVITNTGDTDGSDDITTTTDLVGDVVGPPLSNVVAQIQTIPVDPVMPDPGHVLRYEAGLPGGWVPSFLPPSDLAQEGATNGQVLTWNNTGGIWEPQSLSTVTVPNAYDSYNTNDTLTVNRTVTMQDKRITFAANTTAGTTRTILRMTTPYTADDAFTNYLVGQSPVDSFKIYNYDGITHFQTYGGGGLQIGTTDETMILQAATTIQLDADSIRMALLPRKTQALDLMVYDSITKTVARMRGTLPNQVITWTGTAWAPGVLPATIYTGNGTVGSARVATITDSLTFAGVDAVGGSALVNITATVGSNEPDMLRLREGPTYLDFGRSDIEWEIETNYPLVIRATGGNNIDLEADDVAIPNAVALNQVKSLGGIQGVFGSGGEIKRFVGTADGQIPKWNGTGLYWELGTDATGGGGGGGDILNGGNAGLVTIGSNDNQLRLESNNTVGLYMDANQRLGSGVSSPSARFHLNDLATDNAPLIIGAKTFYNTAAGNQNSVEFNTIFNPASTSTTEFYAHDFSLNMPGSASMNGSVRNGYFTYANTGSAYIAKAVGLQSDMSFSGSGNSPETLGFLSNTTVSGTGHVQLADGGKFTISGDIGIARGLVPVILQNGTNLESPDSSYAVYVPNVAGNMLDYAFFSADASDEVYIGGKVGIGVLVPTEKMHVNGNLKASGNLQLGTATVTASVGANIGINEVLPTAELHVNQNDMGNSGQPGIMITTTSTETNPTNNKAHLRLANEGATNNMFARLDFADSETGNAAAHIQTIITNTTSDYGEMSFYTRNSGGFSERLRLLDYVIAEGLDFPTSGGNLSIRSNDALAANKGGSIVFGGVHRSDGLKTDFAKIKAGKVNAAHGNTAAYLSFFTNANAPLTERMRIDENGGVGIGTTTPAASALLDVTSTTKGSLSAPRMTTTQRDAISSPATGLEVFNTTTNQKNSYNGTAWMTVIFGLNGAATLDFPSTAAGTTSDLTITVTGGIADGDIVNIGVPNGSTVANGSYSAFVSNAGSNLVTVRFTNSNLVTASDPASGSFKVAVIK